MYFIPNFTKQLIAIYIITISQPVGLKVIQTVYQNPHFWYTRKMGRINHIYFVEVFISHGSLICVGVPIKTRLNCRKKDLYSSGQSMI